MMVANDGAMRFIVGESVYELRIGTGGSAYETIVKLVLDGRYEWTFTQPSWRPLALGFGFGVSYLWSARCVIVLPRKLHDVPVTINVDDDLLFVFRRPKDWIFVCETSLRIVGERGESSRLELGDVVEQARWEGETLVILDPEGGAIRITVDDGQLAVALK